MNVAALTAPVASSLSGALREAARRFSLDRHAEIWLREIDATWSLTEVRARVVDVIDETHDVKTFVLRPNRRWRGHRAGQFVAVSVSIDGVRTTRCYSLSSAPGARRDARDAIAITVKRVPGGLVSPWLHAEVKRGDVLTLDAAAGSFTLPTPTPEKILFLSGGSGITPVMAMLRDLAAKNAVHDVVFVHAARSARDVIFGNELAALARRHAGFRLVVVREDATPEETWLRGRLDAAKLRAAVPDFAERATFLCGPTPMMEALAPIWAEAGIANRLTCERFTPVTRAPATKGERVRLTMASGKTVAAEGGSTLLEVLEGAGETPAFGCRMGICHTCRCRKRTGVVENIVTGEVSSEPDEEIRLCVSRAKSDVELGL